MDYETVTVGFSTTLPTGAGTTILFDSTVSTPGFFRSIGSSRFEVTIQNDQAGSLRAYWSRNGGTTWRLYNTQAVALVAAGASSEYDYLVDPFMDWKLDWLNGGVNQATWDGNLVLVCGDRSKGT